MATMNEFTFPSCDGVHEIYARQWLPEGPVRAVVQIAHGVAEHIARYDDFMQFLTEQGIAVVGNDHLGHGRSTRSADELGYFGVEKGWNHVVGDIHRLHRKIKGEYPDVPVFLFGHSMGSFLSRTYAILNGEDLDGLILCGTGHQSKAMVSAGLTASALEIRRHGPDYRSEMLNDMAFGSYNKEFEHVFTPSDWISRERSVVDRYLADPYCGFLPTAGLFHEMMRGISYVTDNGNIRKMPKDLPVLFISGAADPVGENGKGVMRAYSAFIGAGMMDATLKLYPGARHELLNETNKEDVYMDVLCWLNRYC